MYWAMALEDNQRAKRLWCQTTTHISDATTNVRWHHIVVVRDGGQSRHMSSHYKRAIQYSTARHISKRFSDDACLRKHWCLSMCVDRDTSPTSRSQRFRAHMAILISILCVHPSPNHPRAVPNTIARDISHTYKTGHRNYCAMYPFVGL